MGQLILATTNWCFQLSCSCYCSGINFEAIITNAGGLNQIEVNMSIILKSDVASGYTSFDSIQELQYNNLEQVHQLLLLGFVPFAEGLLSHLLYRTLKGCAFAWVALFCWNRNKPWFFSCEDIKHYSLPCVLHLQSHWCRYLYAFAFLHRCSPSDPPGQQESSLNVFDHASSFSKYPAILL